MRRPGIFIAFLLLAAGSLLFAAPPSWWSNGITAITDPNASHAANENYAPVNLGQLKNVAKKAALHLDEVLPSPGAGSTVHTLVNGFQHTSEDYAPINLGQLKAVAKPFYLRLHEVRYDTQANLVAHGYAGAGIFPWNENTPKSENYAPANIGQLKMAFSFNLENFDGDGDGIPDSWENGHGLDPEDFSDSTTDADGDGISNLAEFLGNSDPQGFYSRPNTTITPALIITSGNRQDAPDGGFTTNALSVTVTNSADGQPLVNAPVKFSTPAREGVALLAATKETSALSMAREVRAGAAGSASTYVFQPSGNDEPITVAATSGSSSINLIVRPWGLLGRWRMKDFAHGTSSVAQDDSGAGKDGVVHGSPISAPWLQCDGVNDDVEVPGLQNDLNGRDAITVALWIRSDGVGSAMGDRGFIAGAPYGSRPKADNPLSFRYDKDGAYGGGTNVLKTSIMVDEAGRAAQLENGQQSPNWQHLAFTWKSGQLIALYINGQPMASSGSGNFAGVEEVDFTLHRDMAATGVLTGLTTFFIGRGQRTQAPWKGGIAEARVYSRALTQAEVKKIVAIGEPKQIGISGDTDHDGLTDAQEEGGNWPFATGTNPNKFDTDGDGISDYAEFLNVTAMLGQQLFANGSGEEAGVDVTWRFNGDLSHSDNHSLSLRSGLSTGSNNLILKNIIPGGLGLNLASTQAQFFMRRGQNASDYNTSFYLWSDQQSAARLRATLQPTSDGEPKLRPLHNDLYRMTFYKTGEASPSEPNGTIAEALATSLSIVSQPSLGSDSEGHPRQWSALRGKFVYEQNGGNPWTCDLTPYQWTFGVRSDPDTDHDGLSDGQEKDIFHTLPGNPDTDNDGLPDGWEVRNELNPFGAWDAVSDLDGDSLSATAEYLHGTDPTRKDTDGDGMSDGWEVANGLNPLVNDAGGDLDDDGLTNFGEWQNGTDPRGKDTDGDGMLDGWEVQNGLNPKSNDAIADKDKDRWPNIYEYKHGTKATVTGQRPDPANVVSASPPVYDVNPAQAALSSVDNIFATIGEAVAKSQEHYLDTETQQNVYPNQYAVIRVKAGLYKESVSLAKASVLLLGMPGPNGEVAEIQSQAEAPTGSSDYEVVDDGFDSTITVEDDSVVDGLVISHDQRKSGRGISVANNGTFAPRFLNCVIRQNRADKGAGALIVGAAKFLHCTFFGNISSGVFGSVLQNNGNVELTNGIVWNPDATREIGGSGRLVVKYSDVRGGVVGVGNMDVEPALTSKGWMTAESPARNVGLADDSHWDIQGERRLIGSVDLGADQFVDVDANHLPDWWTRKYLVGFGSATHGDLDGDGVDNLSEYLHGLNPALADEDQDGVTDSQELAAGTDGGRADTDWDGMPDGFELRPENGLDPLVDDAFADKDGDRWPNIFEFKHGTKAGVLGQTADPANTVATLPPVYTVDGTLGSDDAPAFKYRTIQGAVDAARIAPNGRFSVIIVKSGTYTEAPIISGVEILLVSESGLHAPPEIRRATTGSTLKISSPAVVDGFVITHAAGVTGWGVYTLNGTSDSTLERRLVDCVISHNDYGSGNGGAIYSKVVTLRVIHSTLFGNNAGVGKAIYLVSGKVDIWNSIIWDEDAPEDYSGKSEIAVLSGIIGVKTSIIRNGEYEGLNQSPGLAADGQIVDEGSPAIDAAELLPVSNFDISGRFRTSYGGPDIGAYEYRIPGDDEDVYEYSLTSDNDNDGLSAGDEISTYHTDPENIDTDGDGMSDGWEVANGLNPVVNDASGDLDGDGLSNFGEWQNGTDPRVKDSDGDGLTDGEELNIRHTSPTQIDSDGDGVADSWELANGLNPLVNDASANPDGDDATNLQEYLQGRDPHVADNPTVENSTVALKVFTPLDR